VRRLEARVAKDVARGFADDLARAYPTRAVRRWLDSFLAEVGEKLDLFFEPRKDDAAGEFKAPPPPGDERRAPEGDPLAPFRVNLFVDAKERPSPPIVFEPNPTYANLLGGIEGDAGVPDHLRLRAGSLLHANGGVLVVDAAEVQQDPAAWRALKRAVRSGWIEVQRAANQGSALRPEAVRTEFKLVAIGTEEQWDLLSQDPDFGDVFKVKVQLEDELPRSPSTTQEMARALLRAARRSGLRTPDAGALGRLLERSARLSSRADRYASCFDELLDVLQEADRLAAASGRRGTIRAREVEDALERRRRRHDLQERRVQEDLDLRLIDVDLEGARAAVVNALVVYDTGDHAFARPCRVTATTGVGRRGLVDIEREARLSGDFHHKGVQILSALLTERYAQARPLRLTATVCFEQSYALVDGDSASVAEALAVLSALGDAPVRQGWAVTGALDQKGRVQPIGDVNLKVEGFHDACASRGLTGAQGVLIPAANVGDLMLREDVVAAVAAGRFAVVAVRTLDEVLAIMTGLPTAARPSPFEPFPEGTLDARIDARLEAYAEAARRYERGA
jgi:predicted ATP-dependent protease